MSIDWPGVQVVPAATSIMTLQVPLAHCWNAVPPTQLNMPSEVQAPVSAPDEVDDEPVPLAAGAADVLEAEEMATVEEAAAGEAEALETSGLGETAEVADDADPVVAKTPPERVAEAAELEAELTTTVDMVLATGDTAADAELATGEAEATTDEPEPDDPLATAAEPGATQLVPVKDPVSSATVEFLMVFALGSGKTTSLPSTVTHPLSMLATNGPGALE